MTIEQLLERAEALSDAYGADFEWSRWQTTKGVWQYHALLRVPVYGGHKTIACEVGDSFEAALQALIDNASHSGLG